MGGNNMEDLLMGGGDSSSGESDSEAPPSNRAPPTGTAPASRQAQVQQLKSLYSRSPGTKNPNTQPQRPIQQAPPPRQVPPQQQMPLQQQPPSQQSRSRSSQPRQQSYRPSASSMSSHPQQPPQRHPQQPPQRHPHPQMAQQQHRTAINRPPSQHQPSSSRGGMPSQSSSSRSMPPPQPNVSSRSGVPHQRVSGGIPQSRSSQSQRSSQPSSRSSQPTHPQAAMRGLAPQQPQRSTSRGRDPYDPNAVAKMQRVPTTMMPQQQDPALKKKKERFLVFTKVLMKYLEQKEPSLHLRVKAIIKDCAERNKKKEPGYESVTQSMNKRLRQVVSEAYWKRAELYLDHFLKERARDGSKSAQQILQKAPPVASSSHRSAPSSLSQRGPPSSSSKPAADQLVNSFREDIRKKKSQMDASMAASSKPSSSSSKPSSMVAPPFSKPKGGTKKKQSAPSTSNQLQQQQPPPQSRRSSQGAASPAPPKEYNILMEQVDNALKFDWTVAGRILGPKTDYMLSDEQKQLLFDCKPKVTVTPVPTFPTPGWSKRNVLSSRVAWARIRLREHKAEKSDIAPGVQGLPATEKSRVIMDAAATEPTPDTTWHNEAKAEGDPALAALSEGLQIYIKDVLEKALHCARQRQNLDGVRLWQQQLAGGSNKPALSLRLGCDVNRQIALAQGNAAMTCKRMEEALRRETKIPDKEREISQETLSKATSMADLAIRPKLGKAIEEAEAHGKRSFDVFGGKDSQDPPFGRVPKQAKLEVVDFQTGMKFSSNTRRRQRASTMSSSFFF